MNQNSRFIKIPSIRWANYARYVFDNAIDAVVFVDTDMDKIV